MPCKHMICAALHQHTQIPLHCFNQHFWIREPEIRPQDPAHDPDCEALEQQPMDIDPPPPSPPPPPPVESTKELTDQIYMNWSSMMSKFNDQESCSTIALMQCITIQILESARYAPNEMNALKMKLKHETDETIKETNKKFQQCVGVMPSASARVTSRSYSSTPAKVQKALNRALSSATTVAQASPNPRGNRVRRAKEKSNNQ